MATYLIGTGQTYTTFAGIIATLTLPESGGTVFQITGVVADASTTFADTDYADGLTIEANANEKADGQGGGAAISGIIYVETDGATLSKLNINSVIPRLYTFSSEMIITDCFLGYLGTASRPFWADDKVMAILTNTILYSATSSNLDMDSATVNVHAVRCTSIDAGIHGIRRCKATDCLSITSANSDFSEAQTGSDYLASEDTTSNAVTNFFTGRTTDDLVDYAGGDFNLAAVPVGGGALPNLRTSGTAGGVIGADLLAATTTIQVGDIQLDFTPTAKMGILT